MLPERLGGSGAPGWDVHDPMPEVADAVASYTGDPTDAAAMQRHLEKKVGRLVVDSRSSASSRLRDRIKRLLN